MLVLSIQNDEFNGTRRDRPAVREDPKMVQEIGSVDYIESMSNEQLSDLMGKCQDMIDSGSATIDDFEAFVLCQRELARRTWA